MPAKQNGLIVLLPLTERKRLMVQCEPVLLELNEVICEPGDTLQFVHFPVDAFISLLGVEGEHAVLEVGMIGREGMLGLHRVLGVAQAPLRALVQGAGLSLRITSVALRVEIERSATLHAVLLRYTHVCMQQLTSSALCMRFHQVQPRLARWLLMTQDRAHSDRFQVTQEFLSSMLGVRRVGVTAAALALQRLGLIAYQRGGMHVLNRLGLEAAACSCYSNDLRAYRTQFAPDIRKPSG